MRNIKTLTCKIDICPSCNKVRLLYNQCRECGRFFCKDCASNFIVKDDGMPYYTPEVVSCLCKKHSGLNRYVKQRNNRRTSRTKSRNN